MAKQMFFTDEFGEDYPSSYWRPEQINLAPKASGTGMITFCAYKDEAAKGKRVIGQKIYALKRDDILKYFSLAPLDASSAVNAVYSAAYRIANERLDKDSGRTDLDGKPVAVSFFNTAIDV